MGLAHPNWPRALPTWLVVGAATLGPIGRLLPAPGTWGSLVGVGAVAGVLLGFNEGLGPAVLLAAGAVGAWWAVGICGEAEVRLGQQDPGEVILDEFVAMPWCFVGWPVLVGVWPAWVVLALGFGFFRFFDILKPLGIARLQGLPAGWGVVVDDVAAALATCAALHAAQLIWQLV